MSGLPRIPDLSEVLAMPTPQLILWFANLAQPQPDQSGHFKEAQLACFKLAWAELDRRVPAAPDRLCLESDSARLDWLLADVSARSAAVKLLRFPGEDLRATIDRLRKG